ncbi:hypothetical protein JYT20_00685 [Rhodothermus sp. AH-315-K08]|nr:hypothetical protein [Rhodothermus sp. AH-315-K08]
MHHLLISHGFDVVRIDTPGTLDVDLLNVYQKGMGYPFSGVLGMGESDQVILQDLLAQIKASGHMLVLARKRGNSV